MAFRYLVVVVLYSIFTSLTLNAQVNTPDYWKCTNRSGGSWVFGRAPSICDFDDFMPKDSVLEEYSLHIFDDQKDITAERKRYMNEMYAALKKLGTWYLLERKPEAKQDELDAFVRAVMSMAHQESFWSHYRKTTSGRLQMMRGDYGHGHGLFQVDDRWHYNAVVEGKAANMILNGVYSLDEYYAAWVKSATAKCITKETDYYNRARAAYSAYNGGPSKICRWTNPNDTWARNDVGFKAKLDGMSWKSYVTDFDAETALNIPCIAAGGESCAIGEDDTLPPVISLEGLFPVSSFIALKKTINLRKTPGGTKLGVIPTDSSLQVLGHKTFIEESKSDRYYLVSYSGLTGYVYAGTNADYASWASTSSAQKAEKFIYLKGDRLEVASDSGISFWGESGEVEGKIPWGELIEVTGIQITENDSLFYLVSWGERALKIDGGKLGESVILTKDILPYDDLGEPQWGRLVDSIFYMNVRSEKSTSSKINGVLAGPKIKEQLFKIISSDDLWCQVKVAELSGFIKCRYIDKVVR